MRTRHRRHLKYDGVVFRYSLCNLLIGKKFREGLEEILHNYRTYKKLYILQYRIDVYNYYNFENLERFKHLGE
jgi:hypothetical protein